MWIDLRLQAQRQGCGACSARGRTDHRTLLPGIRFTQDQAEFRMQRVSGKASSGQPDRHQPTHREINPRFLRCREDLEVLAQAAVPAQPGKRPFHDPAPRQDLEARRALRRLLPRPDPDPRWRLAHDLHRPAQRRRDPARTRPLVGGIDPDLGQPREGRVQAGEQLSGAIAVGDIGRMDADLEQQAGRIGQDVALAPTDLFGPVVATGPPFSVVLTD